MFSTYSDRNSLARVLFGTPYTSLNRDEQQEVEHTIEDKNTNEN